MIPNSLKKCSSRYAGLSLLVGLSCLCCQTSARAQLVITSTNPNIFTATPGQTVSLNAMVQNLFSTSFYFLGDNANFTSAAGPTEIGPPTSNLTVALDDTPFAGSGGSPGFPPPLAAGEKRQMPLANIFVGQNATPGTYNGYFTIQGNTDPNGVALDQVTQNFQLTVQAIPETSTLLSLGLLVSFGAWNFRRLRRTPVGEQR